METILTVVSLALLGLAVIELIRINSKVDALKEEQNRHNNIQSVILDQVDEINQKIG